MCRLEVPHLVTLHHVERRLEQYLHRFAMIGATIVTLIVTIDEKIVRIVVGTRKESASNT
jgi:preprotein translocase subunit SecY